MPIEKKDGIWRHRCPDGEMSKRILFSLHGWEITAGGFHSDFSINNCPSCGEELKDPTEKE